MSTTATVTSAQKVTIADALEAEAKKEGKDNVQVKLTPEARPWALPTFFTALIVALGWFIIQYPIPACYGGLNGPQGFSALVGIVSCGASLVGLVVFLFSLWKYRRL